jgi:hypothetical protein
MQDAISNLHLTKEFWMIVEPLLSNDEAVYWVVIRRRMKWVCLMRILFMLKCGVAWKDRNFLPTRFEVRWLDSRRKTVRSMVRNGFEGCGD